VKASEGARKADQPEGVDAVTAATPKAGTEPLAVKWDLKDWAGKTVPVGEYVFKLQCDGKRGVITWSAKLAVGDKAGETVAKPDPEPNQSNTYVRDLKIIFRPS